MKGILLSFVALLLIGGCQKDVEETDSPSASQQTYDFNYAVFFPANHLQARTARAWAEEVGRRTDGRVKITLFHGGKLARAAQIYEAVVSGVADIGLGVFAYTRGRSNPSSRGNRPLV